MNISAGLAKAEALWRPMLTRLPASWAVRIYSRGRARFLPLLAAEVPTCAYVPPQELARTLWGIDFRSPISNAAGMFKQGEGYALVARQGAGAWLAGTTTAGERRGNLRAGIKTPFAPYPRSHAASNWLGLPNPGHAVVARRIAALERVPGCPIGASLSADPDAELQTEQKLAGLVAGMRLYEEARVDFLEMNESCPNTEAGAEDFSQLAARLRHVATEFLAKRSRPLPVIVKFSNDTEPAQVEPLVSLLLELGYDGVNFGNTSTAYSEHAKAIDERERPLYDYFTSTFGGGLSGRPLREKSFALCQKAVEIVRAEAPAREFHVVRTGGIESAADVRASEAIGVPLCQWYSAYFEHFSAHGHDLYRRFFAA